MKEQMQSKVHKISQSIYIQNSVAYTLWLNSKQLAPFVARCLFQLPHETKLDLP